MFITWESTLTIGEIAQDIRTHNTDDRIHIRLQECLFTYDLDRQEIICRNTDRITPIGKWSLEMILAWCLGYSYSKEDHNAIAS